MRKICNRFLGLSILALIVQCVFVFEVFANGPLRSIIIFGNEKTERATIIRIIAVEPQTYVNKKLLREVDDRLANSGLFKKVNVSMVDNPDGTADLRVSVVEKQLWFIFPNFQAWSGRYSGGIAFGESNLFMSNTSTLLLLQGGNATSRAFLALDAKNIFESNFAVRTWLLGRTDDVPLYNGSTEIDQINMKDLAVALEPGYQWTNDIRTSVRFNYRYLNYGQSSLVALSGTEGNDVSIEFNFEANSLKRREAFLKGTRLKASYEFAESRFGTDFTYHMQKVEWQQAFSLFRFFNYVLDVEGAIGDETLPFHREFTLGGSSLRGYADRQFRGDTKIVARQNLLFRVFRHKNFSVFGLTFHDLGLLYREANANGPTNDLSRGDLNNGVGGGLRVSLKDILAPVFGVDFAYGVEDRKFRMLLAVGLVDF